MRLRSTRQMPPRSRFHITWSLFWLRPAGRAITGQPNNRVAPPPSRSRAHRYAVISWSGSLPRPEPAEDHSPKVDPISPQHYPVQTAPPQRVSPASTRSPSLRLLFSPTTLITGDSIISSVQCTVVYNRPWSPF